MTKATSLEKPRPLGSRMLSEVHIHNTGNKHDALEVSVHLQGYNLVSIMEMLWDGLQAIPAASRLMEVARLPSSGEVTQGMPCPVLGSPVQK